jgi:glyoxylase-like metal-dependent hydrolase (beta-lactamase superfamily II)
MGLKVKYYPRGLYGENTYLIEDEASGLMAIIDPGYYGDKVRNDIGDADSLKYLLLTHAHDDHWMAVSQYKSEFSEAAFAAPEKDLKLLKKYGCPEPEMLLKEGDTVKLGETELKIIETPGHTAGGICFMTDSVIFTGDTLFKLSVGRTDLETGDWDTLLSSIKEKLYVLDDDMIVYPGHGAATTISFEKRANPFV